MFFFCMAVYMIETQNQILRVFKYEGIIRKLMLVNLPFEYINF